MTSRPPPTADGTALRQAQGRANDRAAATARAFHKAIDNQRRVEAILRDMRALALEHLEATTQRPKPDPERPVCA